MKLRILRAWDRLRSSYWFVPIAISLAALALALVLGTIDEAAQRKYLPSLSGVFLIDESGARAILSTLAASSISVASVVFSIAMLVLSTAASQFGPRLLPNFMREESTQFVLGGFIGTFIYCLLVLSRIRSGQPDSVPQLSVGMALVLGIFSFGLLIHFIHRVSIFIQAPRIIEEVTAALIDTFRRLFPEAIDHESNRDVAEQARSLPKHFGAAGGRVLAKDNGYLQAIDLDRLIALAQQYDVLIRLLKRPGQFVVERHGLALVVPEERTANKLADHIRGAFLIGPERTYTQDAEFAVEQLVEVAIRALSPGINDSFTAINCIDRLGAALSFLASRWLPSPFHYDRENELRVIAEPFTYEGIIDSAFNQVRQNARANEAVTIRLMETIGMLAERELPESFRVHLLHHAQLILEGSRAVLPQSSDRSDLEDRYQAVRDTLQSKA